MINGVLLRISLNEQYPVSAFIDKLSLFNLQIPGLSYEQLSEYYVDLQEIVNFSSKISGAAATNYIYESAESTEIFVHIAYANEEYWNTTNTNFLMTKYQSSKKIVYDALGWVDHGYKVLRSNTESKSFIPSLSSQSSTLIISDTTHALNLWNNS